MSLCFTDSQAMRHWILTERSGNRGRKVWTIYAGCCAREPPVLLGVMEVFRILAEMHRE